MCGLVALHAYHRVAPSIDLQELELVDRALAQRGPDGEGRFRSEDGKTAIAHRRLAIVAPGPEGHQPMVCPDSGLVLAWNGELYDGSALRRELEQQGHAFRTDSDGEVILRAWQTFGVHALDRLVGMFALCIWDPSRDELVLARDPYGHKPLYYADDGWTLRVASQVRALALSPRVDHALDDAAIAGFFLFGSIPDPHTKYRAIRALPAGHYLRCTRVGPETPQPFQSVERVLRQPRHAEGRPAVAARARASISNSVRRHLVGDRPMGVLLSGGLDSAVVAAHAARHSDRVREAFTVSFEALDGTSADEADRSAQLAAMIGLQHHVHRVSAERLEEMLPRILGAMDQPSIDGINVWFACEAAAMRGHRVVLTGMGGDELFAGYPSYRQVPRLVHWGRWARALPGVGRALRIAATPLCGMGLPAKAPGLLEYGGRFGPAWLLRRAVFMPWELPALMGRDRAAQALAQLAPFEDLGRVAAGQTDDYGRVAALEATHYLRHQLLRDADWAGMAHGIEVRAPLADIALAREIAPLMAPQPGNTDKQLLREAWPDALGEFPSGPKQGFTTPLSLCARLVQGSKTAPPSRGGGASHPARDWARAVAQVEGFA